MSIREQLQVLADEADRFASAIEQERATLQTWEARLAQWDRDLQAREAKVKAREDGVEGIRKELALSRATIVGHKEELVKAQAKIDALKVERDAARQEIGPVKAALQELLAREKNVTRSSHE